MAKSANDSNLLDLGVFIREQRRIAELSVRRLAELAGVSNRRQWWLVPAHAADPDCMPEGTASQNEADRIDGH